MTDIVKLEEVKAWLRVDYEDEDLVIYSLLQTAEVLCMDIARLKPTEWESVVSAGTPESEGRSAVIGRTTCTADELVAMRQLLIGAVYYTVGFLFEHREEGDHHGLTNTLANILGSIREGRNT